MNLNEQQIVLTFEFVENGLNESMFNLSTLMANDNFMTDMGTATIISKATSTGTGGLSNQSGPSVFAGQDGIHARFELTQSNQDVFIQVVDMAGRTLYKSTLKNLNAGLQYIDMQYADFERPGKGICIINLNAKEFSLSKKLLIK